MDSIILDQLSGMNIKIAEKFLTDNLYKWRHDIVNGEQRQRDKSYVNNRINMVSINSIILSYYVG